VEEKVKRLEKDVDDLQQELSEVKKDIIDIRTQQQVQQFQIENIEKKLDKIEGNTTWLLRIVIGAIVLYTLQFFWENTPEVSTLILQLLN
jgi:ribosomal protein L29